MKGFVLWAGALLAIAAAAAAQKPEPAPLPTPAPGVVVDADFLIGLWSDSPDCRDPIDFRGDGTFVNQNGSHGTWRIAGDAVTLSGTSSLTVRILPRNHLEITVVNPDGSLGYSRRCIGPNNPQR